MSIGQWIGLIALVLSLYILWQIREVLLLIFAAVVLATTLNRLARRLQRSGMRRGFAIFLSVTILIAVIVGFFLLVVPEFIRQFNELTVRLPKAFELLNSWLDQLETWIPVQLTPYVPNINDLSKEAQPLINRILGSSFAIVSGTLGIALNLLLVLVLTGMFLANPLAYRKLFIRLFPSFYRRQVDNILDKCEVSLGGWVISAAIAMTYVGILSFVGLYFLQVRSALALAVLSGFMNLIPNVGPTVSVIPAMAIALLETPWKSLAVLALYFVIQQTEGNFLTPMMMAQQVSLLPAITLISQLFFLSFFGPLGLLLALPLTVVAKIWLEEVLVKDVLDQWGNKPERDTEIVIVSETLLTSDAIASTEQNQPSVNDGVNNDE